MYREQFRARATSGGDDGPEVSSFDHQLVRRLCLVALAVQDLHHSPPHAGNPLEGWLVERWLVEVVGGKVASGSDWSEWCGVAMMIDYYEEANESCS